MNYHNIIKDDMLNGEGLRVTLFLAGCSHQCAECHNPQTWDENGGIPFDEEAYDELISYLDKPYIKGLTLSGGDPLYPGNRDEVLKLLQRIKEHLPEKDVWLYTGYVYEDIKEDEQIRLILGNVDVLVDGEYVKELRSPDKPYVGSSNQRVIYLKDM